MEKQVVIWAIDPFERITKLDPSRVRQLMNWVLASDYLIQPVHLITEVEGMRNESSPDSNSKESGYLIAAEKAVEEYLIDLKIANYLPVKILVHSGSSRQQSISALLDYSNHLKAPWIVVSSHGRSGIHRLVLGSFAENLLLESRCPIYFLTHGIPLHGKHSKVTRVLFATDFSNESREAFALVVDQARRSQAELILFHEATVPVAVLASAGVGSALLIQDLLPNQVSWAQEESLQWKKLAESRDVSCKWIVKSDGVGTDIGKAILNAAHDEGAEFIAMASMSGLLTSIVIGSVARDVFRANLYPVWIYGPKSLKGADASR